MRVLIVDDHEMVRRGLRLLLSTTPDLEVVGEAADGAAALALLAADPAVDVVLTDVRMPGVDGIELIRRAAGRVPVLALTTFDEASAVRDVIAAGGAGYLLKDIGADALADAVRAVAEGGLVLDPRVARRATAGEEPLALLTAAERRVAEHVARGATNAEIAAALFLVEGTVKNHVSALLRKLDARDRTALALAVARALGTL